MELTPRTLLKSLERFPANGYRIAYSGGLDSQVLLHLCATLRDQGFCGAFSAVHVHHGLHPEADGWARHCADTCAALDIPFTLLYVDASKRPGQSPEEAARNARYAALEATVGEGDCLLTAQHRDDQAETLLLQIFRGAGLAGLSAMPEYADFGRGMLLRPLLYMSRDSILKYAGLRGIQWIDDPSNFETAFDRNFLRREIMPVLKRRWPGIAKALQRSAGHCAEAHEILERMAEKTLAAVTNTTNGTLNLNRFEALETPVQRLVLRIWIRRHELRMPPAEIIQHILDDVITARADADPRVCWADVEVRRYRHQLYLLRRLEPVERYFSAVWDGVTPLNLPRHNGRLESAATLGMGIARGLWRSNKITVRYRTGGECCKTTGHGGRRTLKNLFQERGIPTWVRERIPLVYVEGELAAVGDLWICEPFLGQGKGDDVSLAWRGHGLYGKPMTGTEMSTKIAR